MKERSRSRWSFASWRPSSRKKAREAREAALAKKSSTDDIQVSYSDNASPDVKGTMTPPVERKTKKSTIPRFFKPWKWKRKKKADASKEPIQAYGNEAADPASQPLSQTQEVPTPVDSDATAMNPEAAVSSDTSRVPGPVPTLEMAIQSIGRTADVTKVEINNTDPDSPPVTGEPVPGLAAGTPASPGVAPPPLPEKVGRISPALPPKRNASPAIPPKQGVRGGNVQIAGSPAVNHTNHDVGFAMYGGGQAAARGVGFGSQFHNLPDADGDGPDHSTAIGQCNGDINHADESDEDSLSDYDNKENAKDDSDSDEEYNTSLVARVKRNDSLAFHLRNRPSREALQERNILPQQSNDEKKQIMNAIGTKLVRRLSQRPTQEELQQRNIYKDEGSGKTEKDLKEERKRILVRKLSFRPTVEELRQRNIIKFNEYVEVMEAFDYDRKAEKPWTKLTPQDKASIRKELNDFKSEEMSVHEESRKYTRFHRP